MPHFIVEYTDNIKQQADIPGMLKKAATILDNQDGVFPTGGIRARAIELTDYVIADGKEDDAFVHATLKIGAGRDQPSKDKVGNELFDMMKQHFGELYQQRNLALSLELCAFTKGSTWKHNNIHTRFWK